MTAAFEISIHDIIDALPSAHPGNRKTREKSAIRNIGVHYDAQTVRTPYDPMQRYRAQARYHITKNWGTAKDPAYGFGLMYHYRVDYMGGLWRTQPETVITWSVRHGNSRTLNVCCDLGPGQDPSEEQIAGLRHILSWLCFHRPDIPAGRLDTFGHGEMGQIYGGGPNFGNNTECPGRILEHVRAFRREGRMSRFSLGGILT